jgi:hypothetical protein
MIVNNAPSCGITYDRHSDDSRHDIYDRNVFTIQVAVDSQSSIFYNQIIELVVQTQ